MTIKRSELVAAGFDEASFLARVQSHCGALREYMDHLVKVEEDKNNPNLAPDERRVAFPGPSEHPLVESAVVLLDNGTYLADYRIVGPTLEEKKTALCNRVNELERDAINAINPPRKRRHRQISYSSIWTNHGSKRTPQDDDFIAEMAEIQNKEQAIVEWAAKLEHDIDDLTEENVDAFEVKPWSP